MFAAATGTPNSDSPIAANADTGAVAACFCTGADRSAGGTELTELVAIERCGAVVVEGVVVGAGVVEMVGAVDVVGVVLAGVVIAVLVDDVPVPEDVVPVATDVLGEPVATLLDGVPGVVGGVFPAVVDEPEVAPVTEPAVVPDEVDDPLDAGVVADGTGAAPVEVDCVFCGNAGACEPDAAESVCAVVVAVLVVGADGEFAVPAAPVAVAAPAPAVDDDIDAPAGLSASVSAPAMPWPANIAAPKPIATAPVFIHTGTS